MTASNSLRVINAFELLFILITKLKNKTEFPNDSICVRIVLTQNVLSAYEALSLDAIVMKG